MLISVIQVDVLAVPTASAVPIALSARRRSRQVKHANVTRRVILFLTSKNLLMIVHISKVGAAVEPIVSVELRVFAKLHRAVSAKEEFKVVKELNRDSTC